MALTSVLSIYDPMWASKYQEEEKILISLFGENVKAIHHIGSTSVVGLVAKPEIDILMIIEPSKTISTLTTKLKSLAYDFRGEEPGKSGHWYFSKNQNNRRTHKLHLCFEGHPCIEEQLIFRDYLCDNPSVASKYGDLKLKLERENKEGILEYLNKKAPFIQNIIQEAKEKGYSIN